VKYVVSVLKYSINSGLCILKGKETTVIQSVGDNRTDRAGRTQKTVSPGLHTTSIWFWIHKQYVSSLIAKAKLQSFKPGY